MEKVRPLASAVYSSSSDWPDQNCDSKVSASRRARRKANSFSMMMAQAQIDAAGRHHDLDDRTGLHERLEERNPPVVAGDHFRVHDACPACQVEARRSRDGSLQTAIRAARTGQVPLPALTRAPPAEPS
jgi:hypothetical protein